MRKSPPRAVGLVAAERGDGGRRGAEGRDLPVDVNALPLDVGELSVRPRVRHRVVVGDRGALGRQFDKARLDALVGGGCGRCDIGAHFISCAFILASASV